MKARQAASAGRVVLLATDSTYSLAIFDTLLSAGAEVCLVAVPGPAPAHSLLPVTVPARRTTVVSLAEEHGIPVRHVTNIQYDGTLAAVRDIAPDFLLVACFPVRLPAALCAIPSRAALNLHPSMLPRYRGPAPLFWQLRHGEPDTGVTLHRLTQHFDSGDVYAQARADWPDGSSAAEIDACLAARGTRLFLEAVESWGTAAVTPRPQDQAASSYFPSPAEEDFRVSSNWDARRLFNFMRGTAVWGQPYPLRLERREWRLRRALGYVAQGGLRKVVEVQGREVRFQCRSGVLHASFED